MSHMRRRLEVRLERNDWRQSRSVLRGGKKGDLQPLPAPLLWLKQFCQSKQPQSTKNPTTLMNEATACEWSRGSVKAIFFLAIQIEARRKLEQFVIEILPPSRSL
jgi:hypothetical protein